MELDFGRDPVVRQVRTDSHGRLMSLPVLELPLARHTLHLNGKIDRLDESSATSVASASSPMAPAAPLAVVIDYKSSAEKVLELRSIYAGLALQLPVYAIVAGQLAGREPMAMLYMSLGLKRKPAEPNAPAPEPDTDEFLQGFKPRGLVDAAHAAHLDRALQEDAGEKRASAWYKHKFNKDGSNPKTPTDLLDSGEFQTLLQFTRRKVIELAESLTQGQIAPAPYRLQGQTPCEYCDYTGLCPFDPARDSFREIPRLPAAEVIAQMRDDSENRRLVARPAAEPNE